MSAPTPPVPFVPLPGHPPLRTALLKQPLPDAAPPTSPLEALQAELQALLPVARSRGRQANDALRILDESNRRMKEREKGKARAVHTVKKERGFTPIPDFDDRPGPALPPPKHIRVRHPSVSSTSSAPHAPRLPPERSISYDNKKKKRKREIADIVDSDGEPDSQRARKMSPQLSVGTSASQGLPKPHVKIQPPPAAVYKAPGAQDFSEPAHMRDQLSTLLPVRPPVPEAAARGPLVPVDVHDDFTTWIPPKVPTPAHTFFAFAEPWLRPVREEDIGYLEHEHDDSATLVLPPLGPHYARVWAAEDTALHGAPLAGTAAAHAVPEPPLPDARARWEPATLADDDLVSGSRAHGPLTERLVAALIPAEQAWRGVKAAEEAMEGRSAGGTGAAAARDKLTVADIEDRVRGAMLGLGLVEEQTDVALIEPVDDPIATALRKAQRELRAVRARTGARKRRLAALARDRLGFQEYADARDALDRHVLAVYARLQRADGARPKKRRTPSGAAAAAAGPPPLPPCPAARGLAPDAELHLRVPEPLPPLVRTRRAWVDAVGGVFAAAQDAQPGRVHGLVRASVYDGVEDEAAEALARAPKPPLILRAPPEPPTEDAEGAPPPATPAAHDEWREMKMEVS